MITLSSKWVRTLLAACVVLTLLNVLSSRSSGGHFDASVAKPAKVKPDDKSPTASEHMSFSVSMESIVPSGTAAVEEEEEKPSEYVEPKIQNQPKPNPPASPKGKWAFRKYLDRINEGLLVVMRTKVSEGPDYDSKSVQKLMDEGRTTKKFKVVELDHYPVESKEKAFIQSHTDAIKYSKFRDSFVAFMDGLMKKCEEDKPAIPGINNDAHYEQARREDKYTHKNGRIPVYGGHWRENYREEPVRTKEYLSYFLRISTAEKNELIRSHEKFMAGLPDAFPPELVDAGKKFGFLQGDGIVYLGGGRYNQLVLLSVSLLREAGSKLPVEVIIPNRKDYDIDLCTNVLPALNGRCKIMSDFLPESLVRRAKSFQLKSLALLVCSFKNVLYLDADNLPIRNVDPLFVNEPFVSKQMIVWPDLWRRSTSPDFYDIANIPYDETHRMRTSYFPGDPLGTQKDAISFHDTKGTIPEASSETGQFMINKEKHARSLFLSLYYNIHGPDYYYPLFSQGAAGEGDKETFIAAAHKLGLPYYQVNEFNREFGPVMSNRKRDYFGMGQYDPIVDFYNGEFGQTNNADVDSFPNNNEDRHKYNYDFHFYKSSAIMFLHANWPKYYIDEMFGGSNSNGRGPFDESGDRRRLYPDSMQKEAGYDFELQVMRHVRLWFCQSQVELHGLSSPDSENRKQACENINAQIDFLKG